MSRIVRFGVPAVVVFALGVAMTYFLLVPKPAKPPDPPALVEQIREVTRLETLDVTVYKKVSFAPEPVPTGSFWGDVFNWARYSLRPPRGRAIIFADVHLGFQFSKIDESNLRIASSRIELRLPPLQAQVELKPGETEVIGSNLDSQQTAQLLELARAAFEREALADSKLRERARASAERSLRALFLSLGFREVQFADPLPVASSG
jgi:hypothetical protein